MPAPTFSPPVPPTIGLSRTTRPRVLVAQFGDGYSQRTANGLNSQPSEWSVSWSPISLTNAETIRAFLASRGGVEAFRWTPPGAGSPVVVICPQWAFSYRGGGLADMQATFVEVFDLGA